MARWTIALVALALCCSASPAFAQQQQQQQQQQQYQKAVPLIATPDMVPWGPGRDRPPLMPAPNTPTGGAWGVPDGWVGGGGWPSNGNNWAGNGNGPDRVWPPFQRAVPLRDRINFFNNNDDRLFPASWSPAGLDAFRESAQRRGSSRLRGFMASGVPVTDLKWVKGVTADGQEVDLPMPGSPRRQQQQQQAKPLQQPQPQQNANNDDNTNKQQQQQQKQQKQQRPAITAYVLGLKNGTTLRVPRPQGARWRQQQRWAQLAPPASSLASGQQQPQQNKSARLAATPLQQQQDQQQRPWQALQDPPRVDVSLMNDRLREIRDRMDKMFDGKGTGPGAFAPLSPSPSPRPPNERQEDELPPKQQQEEDAADNSAGAPPGSQPLQPPKP